MNYHNEELKKAMFNILYSYSFDKKIAWELMIMSASVWIVSLMGFKFNQVYQYLNVGNLDLGGLLFSFVLFIFLITSIVLSLKLAVKSPQLELLWIVIFAFANGVILQSLVQNCAKVYNTSPDMNMINIAFHGTMFISSVFTNLIRHWEFVTNKASRYLTLTSLFACLGCFLYVFSFSGLEEHKEYVRYLFLFIPIIIVNHIYNTIIYLSAKNSKSYVSQQLVNVSSLLYLFVLVPLSFLCF